MTTAPKRAKLQSVHKKTDALLVEECIQGKETAWAALIDKYKNLIYSIPLRYRFSQDEAADIFQSVCMDLLAELPRLREPNALTGWLIQVTRNKCFHKKQTSLRSKVQEIGDLDPPANTPEPENLILQVQQQQLLQEALADLSPKCRLLLEMLFFENPPRPYDEVAKELNLARGSIGFTRRTCLDKLRDRLERPSH
jgi:RNA polymerase sigma factor (sigma-70 family)